MKKLPAYQKTITAFQNMFNISDLLMASMLNISIEEYKWLAFGKEVSFDKLKTHVANLSNFYYNLHDYYLSMPLLKKEETIKKYLQEKLPNVKETTLQKFVDFYYINHTLTNNRKLTGGFGWDLTNMGRDYESGRYIN